MSNVSLILLEDVKDLGMAGDEVKVSAGYARNYLIPQNKAMKSSPGALRKIAAAKERIEEQRRRETADMQALATRIDQTEISIPMQASETGQLFGSVTERIIADYLKESGLTVDPHWIKLPEPLKELGMFNVDVVLQPEITATVKIWIVRPE